MGWLFKKKDDVLDLTERYKKQQERLASIKKQEDTSNTSSVGAIGIFGMQTSTPTSSSGYVSASSEEEKKRKLAKRLMEITDRLEELSNQIYHLQQRVELLEKKSNSGY
jgi:hypothetical protein